MSLRVCVAEFPVLHEVRDGRVSGPFAGISNEIVDSLLYYLNLTLHPADKMGDWDYEKNEFDGCLGRMQKNESDMHLPMVDLPILAPGLKQPRAILSAKVTMASAYLKDQITSSRTEVMDSFASLSSDLWILSGSVELLILTFIFAVILFNKYTGVKVAFFRRRGVKFDLKARVKRSLRLTERVAVGHVLKQHSSYCVKSRLLSGRLFLLLSFFLMFIIMFYFCSMIKTEMVVQKKPETISTYEELLERKDVKPLWTKQMTDHWDFERAKPESLEGRIWSRAKKFGISNCRISGEMANINVVMREVAKQQSVIFAPSQIVELMTKFMCAASRSMNFMPDMMTWVHADASAREKLSGHLITTFLPPDVERKINRAFTALFEFHTMRRSVQVPQGAKSTEIMECLSNAIVMPDHEVEHPDVSHYRNLFLMSFLCLCFAAFVFALELLTHRLARK